jgi:hypothetical protein
MTVVSRAVGEETKVPKLATLAMLTAGPKVVHRLVEVAAKVLEAEFVDGPGSTAAS